MYEGGGVGIAAKGFADLPELLGRVVALIEGCTCDKGCPSCVHSPKCGNGNRPLDKQGAARVLRLLLGTEEPAVAWGEAPRVTLAEAESLSLVPTRSVGTSCDALRHEDAERPPSSPRGAWGPAPAGAGGEEGRTVLFDLETLRGASEVGGWRNIHRMGVAIGVVCHLEEGRFEVFHEPDVKALIEALRSATLVIGYNVKRFDYKVLAGYTGEDYSRLLPTLDLFEEVTKRLGFRVGMGHLALETLGHPKSADGLQSLEWVRQGRLDLVEDYCKKDVEILRDLYLHGRREGFVVYHDRRREVRLRLGVEW